ncbi:MAG: hypothetical protein RR574_13825, partial [Comamonas sp.]
MKFLSRRNVPSAMSLTLIMLMSSSAMAQTPTKTSDTAVAKLGTLQISSAEVQQLLRAMPESERSKVKSDREG